MGLRLGGAARLLCGRGAKGLLHVVERPPRCSFLRLSSSVCEWLAATAAVRQHPIKHSFAGWLARHCFARQPRGAG